MALGKQKSDKAIKGSYILILLQYLEQNYQLDVASLLVEAELSLKELQSRRFFLTTVQYQQFLTAVSSHVDLNECVFGCIEELEVSHHGIMGLLVMCGLTLQHALKAFMKFYRMQSNLITFKLIEQDDKIHIIMIPLPGLGKFEKFTVRMCMATLYKVKKQLLGPLDCVDKVCFTYDKGGDVNQDEGFYQCQVLYNQPDYEMVYPRDQLKIKLKSASQQTFELLEEQCEQSIGTINEKGDIIVDLQTYLRQLCSLSVSLQDVADHFATSTRTLSRYLQKAGVNFQSLLDQERVRRAKDLLIYTDLSLTEIAHQLSFSDSSHFTKVFKRETNQLPSYFRKQDVD